MRAQLLQTALQVLHRVGARAFTLDAVAKEAEVSKGGLIHHFPNREALIAAMFDFVHERFQEKLQRFLEEETPGPGRKIRAYIRVNFEDIEEGHKPYLLSLVELTAVEPGLLMKSRDAVHCDMQEQIQDDGLDPDYASVLMSSSDAFWLGKVLGFIPEGSEQASRMRDKLLAMTRPPYAQYSQADES